MFKNFVLHKSNKITITEGVLKQLIYSRGWQIEPNAIGTVWNMLYKIIYEFYIQADVKLPSRVEKLTKENEKRTWKKHYISMTSKVPWTQDVSIQISGLVYFIDEVANFHGTSITIKGYSKKIRLDTKEAIDKFITRELEKSLK